MSVVGILIALGLLVWLAYRGWSILLLAPLCALIAALLAGQPLLANWTQTFMRTLPALSHSFSRSFSSVRCSAS
jgi:H+/gluconate symporter-like permease